MDLIVLQFLQNKLNLEVSSVREEYGFDAEKENPGVYLNISYDELLAVQELVNEKLKNPTGTKKELP